MARGDFRVLIAGGGVAGLTLANILEQLGIDFIVLEAYSEIAPQAGASIGLWPNGLRVLDQIGCADGFAEGVDYLNQMTLRIKGRRVGRFLGVAHHMIRRHGYNVVFNDRQRLLQVLYERLEQKDKVLVGKRVVRVEQTKTGVKVFTQDKQSFTGHILVGADGVHSFVRSEMWRVAAETSPGYFSTDDLTRVPIHYRCLFGISNPTPSLPSTLVNPVWNGGWSHLIFGGPGGRVYWFMFEKLPSTVFGDKTPRYSKQDESELVDRHRDDVITEEVSFGQLYDNRISSGLTALHEHTFDQWFFGRIITLGDAAHKPNPITGQGGNAAIESVAALANALVSRLDSSSSLPPAAATITSAFAEVQQIRHARASLTVAIAREVQQHEALENPLLEHIAPILFPLLSRDARLERQSQLVVDAVRVDALPVPARPRYVPFTDELPAAPLRGFGGSVFPRMVVALVLVGLAMLAARVTRFDGLADARKGVMGVGLYYTGWEALDAWLARPASGVLWAVVSGPEALYLLVTVCAPVLIWTVEGHRRGANEALFGRLILWPIIFIAISLLHNIAATAPIYYLLALLASTSPLFHRTTARPVPVSVARSLVPSLLLAFAIPTALLFFFFFAPHLSESHYSSSIWQTSTVLWWSAAPLVFSALVKLLSTAIRRCTVDGSREGEVSDPYELRMFENKDVPHLLSAYLVVGLASAAVHLGVLASVVMTDSSDHTTMGLLRSLMGTFQMPATALMLNTGGYDQATEPLRFAEASALLMRWDLILLAAVLVVWCLFEVFEVRRLGYVRTREAVGAGAAALVGLLVLGPGAMYAGVWYWRETVVVGLSEAMGKVEGVPVVKREMNGKSKG